uniref:Tcf transcription factor 7 n=1 Tax=Phallusia mammillata TaxID=59560 RepID=A0A6F9DV39_9ASCI|nr:Tcf transcription factor 7 [Phallusia mammillata]
MPNQLNSDEAANDEPKTYNDEAVGEDEAWQESDELDNLKGDLVDEVDRDPRRPSYDNKVNAQHGHNESNLRNKGDPERDIHSEPGHGRPNFPYTQDIGPFVSGLSQPLFSNMLLPNSSQVPYHPYVPYHSLLYGASSPSELDGKPGMPRPPHGDMPSMYSLPGQLGQIPNPLAPPWSPGPLYPMCTASGVAGVFPYPYPFANLTSASGSINGVSPFPLVRPNPHASGMHPTVIPHPGLHLSGPMTNGQGPGKSMSEKKNMNSDSVPSKRREKEDKPGRPYVKKPLNAFMLYMKEQRAKVVAECTLKESAAINQILGRKWHSLNRDEQQKYYEMARKERQVHMQMFPGWSARDNYGKRKKRKKEKAQDCTAQNPKKCRAVFGLEQQQLWCAPCRRKKKCIRYQQDGDDSDLDDSDASPPQHHYQESPDSSYGHTIPNQSNTFSSNEHSVMSQSSAVANSSGSNQSASSSVLGDRLSPHNGMVEQIKQERSPPLASDPASNITPLSSNRNGEMFHPQMNNFPPSSSGESNFPFAASESSNCAKRARTSESSSSSNHPPKSFTDSHRFQIQDSQHGKGSSSTSKRDGDSHRNRRSNSHNDSPMPAANQNVFNPMLSPTSMGLQSPHGHSHQAPSFFSQLPPYIQMSTLAAAASSPLGGFMGFPGLKGLSSPMNVALNGTSGSVAPGASTASRRTASAVEGKS